MQGLGYAFPQNKNKSSVWIEGLSTAQVRDLH